MTVSVMSLVACDNNGLGWDQAGVVEYNSEGEVYATTLADGITSTQE